MLHRFLIDSDFTVLLNFMDASQFFGFSVFRRHSDVLRFCSAVKAVVSFLCLCSIMPGTSGHALKPIFGLV